MMRAAEPVRSLKEKDTMGGSAETDDREEIVRPPGSPSEPSAVMMATPAAWAPKASQKSSVAVFSLMFTWVVMVGFPLCGCLGTTAPEALGLQPRTSGAPNPSLSHILPL